MISNTPSFRFTNAQHFWSISASVKPSSRSVNRQLASMYFDRMRIILSPTRSSKESVDFNSSGIESQNLNVCGNQAWKCYLPLIPTVFVILGAFGDDPALWGPPFGIPFVIASILYTFLFPKCNPVEFETVILFCTPTLVTARLLLLVLCNAKWLAFGLMRSGDGCL